MQVVIDTNVLVSALLKAGSVPDQALAAVWKHARALYDPRILEEYRTVLGRPKFRAIEPARIEALLAFVAERGKDVGAVARWEGPLPDDDDRMFVEVAVAGHADAIVTGNGADFPASLPVAILSPAAFLKQLGY